MNASIYTLGETVLDIIFEKGKAVDSTPGGAMLNSAVSLGRMNCDVFLMSDLSNDLCGEIVLDFLKKNKVKTNFLSIHASGKTPIAIAALNEKKEASYDFYSADFPENDNVKIPGFTSRDLLLFGSFYSLRDKNRKKILTCIEAAKKAGAHVVYDPNIRKAHCPLSEHEKTMIAENFALADIVRASKEDFENIFETGDFKKAYSIVNQKGCNYFFMTAGGDGAYFCDDKKSIFIPSKPIVPISTIGAGDTFNAGILYGISGYLNQNQSFEEIMRHHSLSIIEKAVEMATEVCLSMENYVTRKN